MTPPLAVRNLTSTTISVSRIERFEDLRTLQSSSNGYFFSSKAASPALPTSPQIGEHAQSFNHQDLDVKLRPFESYTLKSEEGQHLPSSPKTTFRLTIETNNGERYRVDAHPSYTQKSSVLFTPLSSNPSTSYTALFHPSKTIPQLSIHTNHLTNHQEWMSSLPDTLPLSAISIPGTHNSHTYYRALPSVRCQNVDVKKQLENGIRFLDIRVQPVNAADTSKKDMFLVHGAFPVSLTGPKYLDPILQTCYTFLAAHPRETIIVSLKREGIGASTDEHLAALLEKHYFAAHPTLWHTGPSIPYLGAVRGKLVLLRRYNVPSSSPSPQEPSSGLDATSWPASPSHALFPQSPAPLFALQDFCDVLHPSSIPTKLSHVNAHLARAAAQHHPIPGVSTDISNPVPPGPLYLNFLSGSNFFRRACWPEMIAKTVNKGVEEWLCGGHYVCGAEEMGVEMGHPDGEGVDEDKKEGMRGGVVRGVGDGDGSTGVVIMDCVGENGDWELVRLVVGMNRGVLGRCGVNADAVLGV
ncbi:PLC-like phosphodiesterase [Pyrenochaeta sp. DS3sAY3a]|nr:PLC-like phosphodiesterase [Pyrenochaeta sp. DS3sAY3a]